jgi:hypothetical protein
VNTHSGRLHGWQRKVSGDRSQVSEWLKPVRFRRMALGQPQDRFSASQSFASNLKLHTLYLCICLLCICLLQRADHGIRELFSLCIAAHIAGEMAASFVSLIDGFLDPIRDQFLSDMAQHHDGA